MKTIEWLEGTAEHPGFPTIKGGDGTEIVRAAGSPLRQAVCLHAIVIAVGLDYNC